MIWNRIRGLWNAYHAILAVILTVLYWVFLIAISPMIQGWSIAHYPPFILYNVAAIVGLIIAAVRVARRRDAVGRGLCQLSHSGSQADSVYRHGAASYAGARHGARVPAHAHRLLFAFLGCVYVVFLICHFFIPSRLADQLFSDEHEQRTLLVGPVEKARAVNKWILETAAFGFGLRGTPSEGDEEEGRVLHMTRVSDVSMLQRIIRHEGIRQILLLELPLDQEGLNLVVDAANKAGVRLLVLNNLPEIFRHDISFFKLHGKDFISLTG